MALCVATESAGGGCQLAQAASRGVPLVGTASCAVVAGSAPWPWMDGTVERGGLRPKRNSPASQAQLYRLGTTGLGGQMGSWSMALGTRCRSLQAAGTR